ncbi:MAG: glycosyltransferase family 2 protein [Chlamydiales bacterium]|nr:glycosyltransferase family 2 protein [Chlamydiales bacterium]
MKKIAIILTLCSVFFLGFSAKKILHGIKKREAAQKEAAVFAVYEHKPFVIIIPSYNNSLWVEKNLGSVLSQKYDNFRVLYIDDASTDDTYEKVESILSKAFIPYELYRNPKQLGACENIYRAVASCDLNEIIVMVDGDDWLAHEHVLERLNEVYADPDVWMSCGNYLRYTPYTFVRGEAAGEIPRKVIGKNSLRSYVLTKNPLSHLKTFYVSLFNKIRLEDLQTEGRFFDCASDLAMMVPMAEMAGSHFRHVQDILYIYNQISVINDDKIRHARQIACRDEICSRTPYQPLSHLEEAHQ